MRLLLAAFAFVLFSGVLLFNIGGCVPDSYSGSHSGSYLGGYHKGYTSGYCRQGFSAESKWSPSSFPVYANYNQGVHSSAFDDTLYDSIALLDIAEFHFEMFDETNETEFIGFVDSLRSRNSDIILLDYLPLWGASNDWATEAVGTVRRDYFDLINDNDFWLKDADGVEVVYSGYASFNQRLCNFSDNGADIAISDFFAARINLSENLQNNTGVFIDFIDYGSYPDWPCVGNCTTVMDLNNNGLAYSFSTREGEDELALYRASCINFVDNLRAKVNNDRFVIACNGAGYERAEFSSHIDLGMAEKIDLYFPQTKAEWLLAYDTYRQYLSRGVLSYPMILFDVEGKAQDGTNPVEDTVIVSSLIGDGAATLSTDAAVSGRRHWSPERSVNGKINIGQPVGLPTWPAAHDTVYRQFTRGYVKATLLDVWPREFVVVDSVTAPPDTIIISDNWPKQHPGP